MVGSFDKTVDANAVEATAPKFVDDNIAYFHGFFHSYLISGLATVGNFSSGIALIDRKKSVPQLTAGGKYLVIAIMIYQYARIYLQNVQYHLLPNNLPPEPR